MTPPGGIYPFTVPTPVPPPRRRWGVLAIAVAVAALAASSVAGAVVVSGREDPDRYPAAWDPRALDLVAFVERERGLPFKHPVRIDFLDDAAFLREVRGGEASGGASGGEASDREETEARNDQAVLRALGLVSGDVDLSAAGDELAGDGVVGLYSTETERVFVRGETLDDERRLTLVHELTHVLQDQHFDIGQDDDVPLTSGEQAALTAVAEGDADRVEEAWRATLPVAARER